MMPGIDVAPLFVGPTLAVVAAVVLLVALIALARVIVGLALRIIVIVGFVVLVLFLIRLLQAGPPPL